MKMTPLFGCLVLMLTFLMTPQDTEASYFASCKADIVIKRVHKNKKPHAKKNMRKGKVLRLTFTIKRITSAGGHTKQACNRFLKKDVTASFGIPKALQGKIKKGQTRRARYHEWDGMTPKGVVGGRSWRLLAKKPKKPSTPRKLPPPRKVPATR